MSARRRAMKRKVIRAPVYVPYTQAPSGTPRRAPIVTPVSTHEEVGF